MSFYLMIPPVGIKWLPFASFNLWLTLVIFANQAQASDLLGDGDLMVQAAPYAMHWNSDSSHNEWPGLVGLEWENADRWEIGGAFFKNSFYQPCVYIYAGKRWFLPKIMDGLYAKLTGGPLYGYVDEYESKVPANFKGVGLAVLPALGYQFERTNVQVVLLGTAGLTFTVGYTFGLSGSPISQP